MPPTYAANDSSSEKWREACAQSQEWAVEARLRSHKRRRRIKAMGATMLLITVALATLAVLLVTNKI
jgi:hypothetical protein